MTTLITPKEAARRLSFTPEGVRAAIRRGDLPAVKVLGRYHIKLVDFEAVCGAALAPVSQEALPCTTTPPAKNTEIHPATLRTA